MSKLIEEPFKLRNLAIRELEEKNTSVCPLFTSWWYSFPFTRVTTSRRNTRPYLIAFSKHVSRIDVMPLVHCVDLAHSIFALLGNFGCSQLSKCSFILRVESLQKTMNSGLMLLVHHGSLLIPIMTGYTAGVVRWNAVQ